MWSLKGKVEKILNNVALKSQKHLSRENIENQYEVSGGLSEEGPVTIPLIEIRCM